MSHTQNSIRGIRVILKKSVMQTAYEDGELKVETIDTGNHVNTREKPGGTTFLIKLPFVRIFE